MAQPIFTDVRSTYRPTKPAIGTTLVAVPVLAFLAYRQGQAAIGYDRLYRLGLALPPQSTFAGVEPDGFKLGDFAYVSGTAFLAWLGIIVITFGLAYSCWAYAYTDDVMSKEMEDQVNRQRDNELHRAEVAGRSAGGGGMAPIPQQSPMMGQQLAPGMGYPPPNGYPGNYPPPAALGQG